MTADVELLPCPFCGKSNQDRYPCEWLDDSGANVIRCAWCHGAAPASTWNLRTAPPSAPVGVTPECLSALRSYQQADAEGVMVTVSRQALDEVIAALAQQPKSEAEILCGLLARARAKPGPAQQPATVDGAMVFRLAVWMAKQDGHDDPHQLIWEGSPPEPWGEIWMRYEGDARSALTAALAAQPGSFDNGR